MTPWDGARGAASCPDCGVAGWGFDTDETREDRWPAMLTDWYRLSKGGFRERINQIASQLDADLRLFTSITTVAIAEEAVLGNLLNACLDEQERRDAARAKVG